tara:strand:+ start:20895 stop:24626 length:3732 start_codon:yes stop_codon:yes gene_type:complete
MAVTLDFDASVEKITSKLDQTKKDLVGISKSYTDIKNKSSEALEVAAGAQDLFAGKVNKSSKSISKQTGIIEKLEAHLKRLEIGQKKAITTDNIVKYNVEIAKTQATLSAMNTKGVSGFKAIDGAAIASKGVFNSLRATLASTFAPLFAVGAAVQALTQVVALVTSYEQAAADLSAITGAQGDTLEYLKQQSVEVATTTTISAEATLEAYKLIASAKPELLSNAEGLAEITRQAVTLTEAMGGELPAVAKDLTDVMNQFNAPASEAGRFVNALAAGSQKGSASVAELAAALLVTGTEAQSGNVKFEESIGLLETLAEKGIKGAEAGTAMRNIFSKLSATELLPKDALARLSKAGVDISQLSDKSLTFSQRLEALKPIQNDANALTAVFGLENKSTAQILVGNIDRIDELTGAVTNTNTAQEQAAIRTKTLGGEYLRLKNTLQAMVQQGGGGIGKFLTILLSFARNGLLVVKGALESLEPTWTAFGQAISELVNSIKSLLPSQDQLGENFSLIGIIVDRIVVPIKIFFSLLSFGIKIIAGTIKFMGDLIKKIPYVGAGFSKLGYYIGAFNRSFAELPKYLSAALAALEVFISETRGAFANLGKNIGMVLKEAFSFKKLISSGSGDLDKAVDKLLVNPFKDVGKKVKKAFTDELKKSPIKAELEVESVVKDAKKSPVIDPVKSLANADAKNKLAQDKKADEAAKLAKRKAEQRERLILEAMANGMEKQLASEKIRFESLVEELDKFNLDTSQATYQHELNKYKIKSDFISKTADLENLTGAERINFLYNQTKSEIDAIESALLEASGGELLEDQKAQLNLLRKNASDEFLKNITAFQDSEKESALNHEISLLELQRDQFKTQADFEEYKQKQILAIRLKYAEAQLSLLETTQGRESDAALGIKKTINEIKGTLASLTEENTAKDFNIFKMLGLDPDDPQGAKIIGGITDMASAAKDILGQISAARLAEIDQNIKASDEEIKAIDSKIVNKENELENEKELSDQGYANNSLALSRDIAQLKEQKKIEAVERKKAFVEKQKIQRQQAIMDTITQGSSLLTASAEIFQSVASIPFIGPILGAGLVGAMIGSFVTAKAKIFKNIRTQKAKKGLYGEVKGKRHSDGGEAFGDHIEVEDGEAFGVLSRGSTEKYKKPFKNIVEALNTRSDKKVQMAAFSLLNTKNKKLASNVAGTQNNLMLLNSGANSTLKTEALLKSLVDFNDQNKKEVSFLDGKKIIKKGNFIRVIKLK